MENERFISGHKVQITPDGEGLLTVYRGEDEECIGSIGNVKNQSASFIENLAKQFLDANDYIEDKEAEVFEKDEPVLVDEEADLDFIRVQMRKIMKNLMSQKVSKQEKKEMLAIYGTVVAAAGVTLNSCKTEIAIKQFNANLRKRIK